MEIHNWEYYVHIKQERQPDLFRICSICGEAEILTTYYNNLEWDKITYSNTAFDGSASEQNMYRVHLRDCNEKIEYTPDSAIYKWMHK